MHCSRFVSTLLLSHSYPVIQYPASQRIDNDIHRFHQVQQPEEIRCIFLDHAHVGVKAEQQIFIRQVHFCPSLFFRRLKTSSYRYLAQPIHSRRSVDYSERWSDKHFIYQTTQTSVFSSSSIAWFRCVLCTDGTAMQAWITIGFRVRIDAQSFALTIPNSSFWTSVEILWQTMRIQLLRSCFPVYAS